ncbi:hypothetical protein D3C75_1362570 [compost metagenome]
MHDGQGQARGVLLAAQVAGQAAVQAQAQLRQVLAEGLALAHAHGREDIIVVCTK